MISGPRYGRNNALDEPYQLLRKHLRDGNYSISGPDQHYFPVCEQGEYIIDCHTRNRSWAKSIKSSPACGVTIRSGGGRQWDGGMVEYG